MTFKRKGDNIFVNEYIFRYFTWINSEGCMNVNVEWKKYKAFFTYDT